LTFTAEEILQNLKNAKEYASTYTFPDSRYYLSLAIRSYSDALNSVSRWWRFRNVYGGLVWIYLIGILAALFFVFYYHRDILEANLSVDPSAINAAAWGIIGAVLRAMWWLRGKVDKRLYRISYNIYFVSIPFIGGMLGSVIYLIILGGLVALGTGSEGVVNPLAIIPFAALAGYNWLWAITIFNKIGDLLTDTKTEIKSDI
jgi:hypothetical protein